jgi:hypothetical protein
MTINSGKRTRKDWLMDTFDNYAGDTEDQVERALRKEDELIWAWYRDPATDLTQTEARDRAQGPLGTNRDYGRFNISQSAVSRKIKKLDDTMLTEPVLRLNMHANVSYYEDWPEHNGGLIDLSSFSTRAKHNPASLDMLRRPLARFIIDMRAVYAFRREDHKTPDWAQDRFPDRDPDMGRKEHKAAWPEDDGELHEPHAD